jgi:hypothetical protein
MQTKHHKRSMAFDSFAQRVCELGAELDMSPALVVVTQSICRHEVLIVLRNSVRNCMGSRHCINL